jgi:hypothetical protein
MTLVYVYKSLYTDSSAQGTVILCAAPMTPPRVLFQVAVLRLQRIGTSR